MSFLLALAIAASSGFIALSYEILWYRAFSFVSGGSPASFGLLLGFYLLGLALGSLASEIFCRDQTAAGSQRQLMIVAGFIFLADVLAYLVLPGLAWISTLQAHVGGFTVAWGAGLPLVVVAAGMMGAILPLVSHFGIAPDRLAGARLSYLYLANILGSACGSLITGFVLMQIWSTQSIAIGVALLGLLLAAALLATGPVPTRFRTPAWGGLVVTAVAIVGCTPRLFSGFYERLLYKEAAAQNPPFAHLVENRYGVIAVEPSGKVYGGGAYDGVISTDLVNDRNWIVRAYGIGALHPAPHEVLEIGLSTGAWAQVLVNLPGVEHLTIVEINPGYLGLIRQYPEVASILTNPKVSIVIDDGRRWLARHPERTFDLVVSNTSFHWRAHVTNLLSREFLELVRAHLKPGGIVHLNTTYSWDALKTVFDVFPYGLRFVNFATASDSPIISDPERWRSVLTAMKIDGRPVLNPADSLDRRRLGELLNFATSMERPPVFLGMESRSAMLREAPAWAKDITDDNMASEWRFNRLDVFKAQ